MVTRAKKIEDLYGQKIAIAGFGREGRSVLDFLRHTPEFHGAEIWVLDRMKLTDIPKGIRTASGVNYLADLGNFDTVFRSPGIPYLTHEIQAALKAGVEISSATKLFFDEIAKMRPKPLIVGITGTKGKGTTSTLLYQILKAAGKNVFLGGNIGTSPLALLPELHKTKKAIVVLELSSFQLQDLHISPHVAAVLETFPDHQDSHKDLKEYYSAKANIARHQHASDLVFFFPHNKMSAWIGNHGKGEKRPVDPEHFIFFSPKDIRVPGIHNFKNAVMAASVAQALGVPKRIIVNTVRAFRGTEHRLELVRTVNGVHFFNDSASTNPHTAAAAVLAFEGKSNILIAGGQDKNLDYAPLAKALKKSGTKLVVLYGENKEKIRKTIEKSGVSIKMARTLQEAVRSALSFTHAAHIWAVIFSPGATSFDMFKNYMDRGAQFKAIIGKLK